MKDDIVIVGAGRTPVGAFNGAFGSLPHALRIGGDLDAGTLLLEQHDHARVASLPAAVAGFRHLGMGQIADAHGLIDVGSRKEDLKFRI